MYLVALQLGMFERRRQDNHPSGIVNFTSHQVAFLRWITKKRLQHSDYLIESVVVVVQQDYIVRRLEPGMLICIGLLFFFNHW